MCNHHSVMTRKNRNPEKFDVLDLYDAIGRNKGYIIGRKEDETSFSKQITAALSDAETPTMLHGRRVEAMFSYVVASLGNCILLKKEDSGDLFTTDTTIEIPDYRLVLNSGEQILVEVKNCHPKQLGGCFRLKCSYLEGLKRYQRW